MHHPYFFLEILKIDLNKKMPLKLSKCFVPVFYACKFPLHTERTVSASEFMIYQLNCHQTPASL